MSIVVKIREAVQLYYAYTGELPQDIIVNEAVWNEILMDRIAQYNLYIGNDPMQTPYFMGLPLQVNPNENAPPVQFSELKEYETVH